MSSTAPQAGWYPAPGEPGLEREWDGAGWTDERRPQAPRVEVSGPGGLAIAGFVMSVVALLLSFAGGGFIPGLVAVVLLAVGRRRGRNPLRLAGVVLAVMAMLLSIVILVVRIAATGNAAL